MPVETCPYCREVIAGQDIIRCPSCGTPHHRDCFVENGGCTVFGCESAPTDEPKIRVSLAETPSAPVTSVAQTKLLYVYRDDEQRGPYSVSEFQQLVTDSRIAMTDLAWREGMPHWGFVEDMIRLPQTAGLSSAPGRPSASGQFEANAYTPPSPMFLYIPVSRLIVMSLISFGLYALYWMYRNWDFLHRRDRLRIQPFWRAIFGIFFINSLLRTIKNDKVASHLVRCSYSSGGLAAGWIIFTLIGNVLTRSLAPGTSLLGILLSLSAFLFLVPVQRYINYVNKSLPVRPNYSGWTIGQIAILLIALGALFWGFLQVGQ